MYIIACIKNGIVHSSDNTLFMSLEPAIARLKILEEHGKTFLRIYEIMDLKEVKL
jgi:hypothetical protein